MTKTKTHDTVESFDEQIAALTAQRTALAEKESIAEHFKDDTGEPFVDQDEIDRALLRSVGGAMERRLHAGRAAGKKGWQSASTADLLERAKSNLEAGQYTDAALYCSMLSAMHSA